MIKLDELIGEKILICPAIPFSPQHHVGRIYVVTLHGVESGGIWIESDILTKALEAVFEQKYQVSISERKTPVYFLPYAQITYLLEWSSKIDEKSFGLDADS